MSNLTFLHVPMKRKIGETIHHDEEDQDQPMIVEIDDPLRMEFNLQLEIRGKNVRVLYSRIPGHVDDDVVFTEGHQSKKNRGLTVTVNGESNERCLLADTDAVDACKRGDLSTLKVAVKDQFEWNSATIMKSCVNDTIRAILQMDTRKRQPFYQALAPLFTALQHHVSVKSRFKPHFEYLWSLENPHYLLLLFNVAAEAYDFELMRFLKPFATKPHSLTRAFINKIREQPKSKYGYFSVTSRSDLLLNGWDVALIKEIFALSKYRDCGQDIRHYILTFVFGVTMGNTVFIHDTWF